MTGRLIALTENRDMMAPVETQANRIAWVVAVVAVVIVLAMIVAAINQ
jgi:uncharacterized integral membrane protein